jgi:hypothetical protein
MTSATTIPVEDILGNEDQVIDSRLIGSSPQGRLPVDSDFLNTQPSGHLFGMTEDAGMGWEPNDTRNP